MIAFVRWAAEEWRLMLTPEWGGGAYDNRPTPEVFTRQDPRCQAVELRQREVAEQLKGAGVLAPRARISTGWEHDERAFRFLRRA